MPAPALEVGREGLAQERRPRRHGDPAGRLQPGGPQRASAEEERGALAAPQRLGHLVDGVGRHDARPAARPWRARARGRLRPRRVRRQDQGGHAARRTEGGGHRIGGIGGHVVGPRRRAVPPRHGAGDGRDVGLQRRVVAGVVRRVVADDVDDRRPGPPGVVQVGQPVAEARARGAAAWPPGDRPRARTRRRRR